MSLNSTKINHKNAPHIVIVTVDIKVCEQKNDGSFVPVTKNKPLIVSRKFKNFDEAKEEETQTIKRFSLINSNILSIHQETLNGSN